MNRITSKHEVEPKKAGVGVKVSRLDVQRSHSKFSKPHLFLDFLLEFWECGVPFHFYRS